jgi:hypothetical protein
MKTDYKEDKSARNYECRSAMSAMPCMGDELMMGVLVLGTVVP